MNASIETAVPGRPALAAQGVDKRFKIPEERSHTLKERALHPLRRSRHEELHALKDISFAVEPGEFFGIVGRNGSGKSTLLKCLAGIYRADQGKIWCNGRMSTFIELGVGFTPDLAAFDNVALNGIMLGLSPREARARYERVIEFAELEEFQDLKLKNYSSGMHVRLAFSVAIQVDADILLIDEVLAVGDATFQQRCLNRMQQVVESGTTLVLVSHDLAAVEGTCNRCLWLNDGVLLADGPIRDVLGIYRQWIEEVSEQLQGVKGEIEILKATATDGDRGSPRSDEPMEVRLVVQSDRAYHTTFFLGVSEGPATPIFVLRYNGHLEEGENEVVCMMRHLPLPRGRFYVWVYAKDNRNKQLLPWHPACFFDVIGNRLQRAPRGIIRLSSVQVTGDWTIS
jgi:ABC-type polysaccharide/polyol phosphate transport system ATPase subunit